ncbi:MAG: stage 0 sporulation family protein [Clostridia bacterium]|nr:stage 0 sporulation family protein [Clostridia bacterium]
MQDKKRKQQKNPPAPVAVEQEQQTLEGDIEIIGINFREAGKIYYFSPAGNTFTVGERVIVETARGVEMGVVKVANKIVDGKEVVAPLKPVIRKATEEDTLHDRENQEREMEAAIICKRKIAEHKLDMSLVEAEYTFDNSKLIFYFTCETRVDFRELVKDLASTFRTRIELRQIGIRDEAKMMGGLGICGRKFCCSGFLTDFVQVSIRMAKEQNFTLNSSKASGACGRLMCCLRYEHEVYDEAIRNTPPVGSQVKTQDGVGVIVETRPLAETVKVRITARDKEEIRVYKISDITVLRRPQGKGEEDTRVGDGEEG